MEERIGEMFLDQTRYERMTPSDQQKGLPQPGLERILASGDRLALPAMSAVIRPAAGLFETIERRTSLRKYADTPLTLEELGLLLWSSQGVKRVEPDRFTFRTIPSAGARHAFETVLLANRVEGLRPGLYQYCALQHELRSFEFEEGISPRLAEACLGQTMLESCAAAFLWVADRARMVWRYGERGIRYLFLDAGHVCQNLYLAAEAIGAGACAIAAFDDDRVNALLGLDGLDAFTVYLATVGKRDEESAA